MAKYNINPDSLAKKTFLMTVVGALLYIGVVFAFVIGGNRREEAAEQQGQLADPAHVVPSEVVPSHAGSAESEHHP